MHLLFAMLLVTLFSFGCNKDDDDGGGNNGGNGGNLEITLTWNTSDADIDLSLVGPNSIIAGPGATNDPTIVTSPDDLEGPGEEFIRFTEDAPDGQYIVSVNAFTENVEIPFELRIENDSDGRTFNESVTDDGTGNNDDDVFIVVFNKSGNNLNF